MDIMDLHNNQMKNLLKELKNRTALVNKESLT